MNQVIHKMIDDMNIQKLLSSSVIKSISISGLHFLKEDDATSVLVCTQQVDGVTEHAIAIWQGKIYNLYQEYVLEQSHAEFYAICA
jgi:hypothetical protein